MNLRTKLLLGYLMFVTALIVLGGWSAWHLREMGGVSRNIIANNYDSVVAAQGMRESLDRQGSAVLFALLGRPDPALTQLAEERKRFDAHFQRAANNITEPTEGEIIESIRQDRDAYYRLVDAFLAQMRTSRRGASTTPAAPGMDAFDPGGNFIRLEALFHQLQADCANLVQVNQRAMVAKSEAAAGVARRWFLTTLAIAGSLILAGIGLAVVLADRIVRPLRSLTATMERVAGGDLDAKANVESHDEVGILAAGFNSMAERIRQLRRSDLGKLFVAQQTTEAAIDSLYNPVIVTDAQGRVTKLNPAAEEIFGPEVKNIGMHIREIARDSRIPMAVSETLSSQQPVAGEGAASVLPLVVDGSEHAFRLRTTPMRDEEGRLLGAVTLLEDITHLREIDRLKSGFIATASHELRTPLTSVQMSVHLLLEGASGTLTERQQEVLAACREDCDRLEKLMRDLLDLSKIEAGEAAPHLLPVSAGDLIAATAESFRTQVESKGIRFRIDVPTDLPSVLADRAQIERVVSNLISNALRHTDAGGEIKINAIRRDGQVAVSVADTGHGIPPEYLPTIFDRFVRVPNAPLGGAGLGLAISKGIVEAHGGQIVVQSRVGHGTTFTFTLQVASEPPAASPARTWEKTHEDTDPGH
jgi:PAS domain S-box-containing protein